jgi:hypothetical protein
MRRGARVTVVVGDELGVAVAELEAVAVVVPVPPPPIGRPPPSRPPSEALAEGLGEVLAEEEAAGATEDEADDEALAAPVGSRPPRIGRPVPELALADGVALADPLAVAVVVAVAVGVVHVVAAPADPPEARTAAAMRLTTPAPAMPTAVVWRGREGTAMGRAPVGAAASCWVGARVRDIRGTTGTCRG